MSDTYLAVFVGSKTSAKAAAWNALSETERKAKEKEGIAGWKAWVEKHQAALAEIGGPLGKTKRVGPDGIADISNELGAFTVVRAESHEAAARMFRSGGDHACSADPGWLTAALVTFAPSSCKSLSHELAQGTTPRRARLSSR